MKTDKFKKDTLTFLNSSDAIGEGDIITSMGHSSRWRSMFVVKKVDSSTQVTVKWAWWYEPWYYDLQLIVVVGLYAWAGYLIFGKGLSG